MQRSVDNIVRSLDSQALKGGIATVSSVGVAVDWVPSEGLAYLEELGHFDEMIVGRSWLNTGVDKYLRTFKGELAAPQVLVFERTVTPAKEGKILIDAERLILAKRGIEAIDEWARQGAPVVLQ